MRSAVPDVATDPIHSPPCLYPAPRRIDDFADFPECTVNSSGYVVNTPEAALWCLLSTSDHKSCVPTAVSLGGDTNTVTAVTECLRACTTAMTRFRRNGYSNSRDRVMSRGLCERVGEVV